MRTCYTQGPSLEVVDLRRLSKSNYHHTTVTDVCGIWALYAQSKIFVLLHACTGAACITKSIV